MGATPNYDDASLGSVPSNTAAGSPADDISFNRGGIGGTVQSGTDTRSTVDSAKQMLDTGVHKAQDAMGQLQAKASELTARLVDNIDIDDLTQKLEQQVREHPARTLLLAAGAGYLLGRSLHK